MAAASQTLSRLTTSLLNLRGIEKNLLAKKFIKSVIYSKESIQINLFDTPRENKNASGISAGKLVCNKYMAPPFRSIQIIYRLFFPIG